VPQVSPSPCDHATEKKKELPTVDDAVLVRGRLEVPVSVLEATKGLDVATPEYSWMAMVPSATDETWNDEPPVTFLA
jgi:hypothetical protein